MWQPRCNRRNILYESTSPSSSSVFLLWLNITGGNLLKAGDCFVFYLAPLYVYHGKVLFRFNPKFTTDGTVQNPLQIAFCVWNFLCFNHGKSFVIMAQL